MLEQAARPVLYLLRVHWLNGLVLIFLAGSLGACNLPSQNNLPTPISAAELPTAIAATMAAYQTELPAPLTVEAGPGEQGIISDPGGSVEQSDIIQYTPTPQPILEQTSPVEPADKLTETVDSGEMAGSIGTLTVTTTPEPSRTPGFNRTPGVNRTPTPTLFPELPIAGIQVFRPGDLSKVASPIDVSAYLRPGAQGRVTIELFGEDGRLLVRQIRVYDVPPGARVNLSEKVPFQISAAAEVGRLVLSMADEAGRTIALSSVDLILLSMGYSDINPSDMLQEFIYIREPKLKSLVQGGTVLVSGLARPFVDQPLVVHLITEDGKVVGQRVVGVGERLASGYGEFAVEVAYRVDKLTAVRLTIYEIGLPITPIRYLASQEVVLGP